MSFDVINAPPSWDGAEGLLAIVVRADYRADGVNFFTAPDSPLQLASISYPKGHVVEPHVHRVLSRTVSRTQEVLAVCEGSIRVDLYLSDGTPYVRATLHAGDWIFLAGGGHGLEALEPSVVREIKVGPYLGRERDKVRLVPRAADG